MRRFFLLASLVSLACASTELTPGAADPANPRAAQGPVVSLPPTLEAGFDPFATQAGAPGASGHDHAGHDPATEPGSGPSAATYTCPMHPEIRAKEPGRCPKCGMKLEPVGAKK